MKKLRLIILIATIALTDILFRNQLMLCRGDSFSHKTIKLFTSSFVHWNNEHLLWNMLALLLIGIFVISHREKLFWQAIVFAPIPIGLAVLIFSPATTTYCGFSGIAFTLLVLACGKFITSKSKNLRIYGWLTIAGTIAKVLWELVTGNPLFAEGSTFHVVQVAHLTGILVGLTILCFHHIKLLHLKEWKNLYLLFFG